MSDAAWKNKLFFGDNLRILREHVADESVDLIYLDPPFNSNATYNVLFKERSGKDSSAQITAFGDTWHWNGIETESAYFDVVTNGGRLSTLMQAFRSFLGQSDMMAYLVMMAPRLVELRRVLKPTGSIYLHCDPTASHYLKLVMDAIFDPCNFLGEVIWKRTSAHSSAKRYGPVHDVILFYARSGAYIWSPQFVPYSDEYLDAFYTHRDPDGRRWRRSDLTGAGIRHGETGLPWRGIDVTAKGRHWSVPPSALDELDAKGRIHWPAKEGGMPMYKRYADEMPGVPMQDVWDDIRPMHNLAAERLHYPTQKPEALLERIIKSSSNEGDIVLDPFCGCGTAVSSAEKLHRRWIGIDITHLAITLIKSRLATAYGSELAPYEVAGDPKDVESARTLAEVDRYQFEWWALGLVDARPAQDKKKGADKGVDGYIYFFDDGTPVAKRAVVQVKSGHVRRDMIATLNNDRVREKAEVAVFVTLEEPSEPMRKEAAGVGFYQPDYFPGLKVPRIQILTIAELLAGEKVEIPITAPSQMATFKAAARVRKAAAPQQVGFFDQPM